MYRLLCIVAVVVLAVGAVHAQPPKPEAKTPYDTPPQPAPAQPTATTPFDTPPPPDATATPAPAPTTTAPAPAPPPYTGPGRVQPPTFGPTVVPQPPSFDRPARQPRRRGPDGKLIGGIIAAIVGAGALVTFGVAQGMIASLQDDPGFDAYRRGISPSQSACDEAETQRTVSIAGAASPAEVVDICKRAHTYELVSYVMLPTGIIMLGLGGFLIFTSDTARGRRGATLEVVPRAGFHGASADLVLSF